MVEFGKFFKASIMRKDQNRSIMIPPEKVLAVVPKLREESLNATSEARVMVKPYQTIKIEDPRVSVPIVEQLAKYLVDNGLQAMATADLLLELGTTKDPAEQARLRGILMANISNEVPTNVPWRGPGKKISDQSSVYRDDAYLKKIYVPALSTLDGLAVGLSLTIDQADTLRRQTLGIQGRLAKAFKENQQAALKARGKAKSASESLDALFNKVAQRIISPDFIRDRSLGSDITKMSKDSANASNSRIDARRLEGVARSAGTSFLGVLGSVERATLSEEELLTLHQMVETAWSLLFAQYQRDLAIMLQQSSLGAVREVFAGFVSSVTNRRQQLTGEVENYRRKYPALEE